MEINVSGHFENPENHSSPVNDFTSQSENYDERNYYTIAVCVAVNVLLSFTALFGNCAILITLWKTPSLHSPESILLASLAVSDLAVGLVIHPLYITAFLKNSYIQHNSFEVVFDFLVTFLCNASFFTATAIGVDRLLAVQLHLRYEAVVTSFRVTGVVTLIWALSGLFSSTRLWIPRVFYNGLSPLTFVLLVVNFGVYLKIYLIVRRHQIQIAHQQQQQHQGHDGNIFWRLKKSAVNTFLVFTVLLFCYMPCSLLFLKGDKLGFYSSSAAVGIISTTITLLNSSLNPLLYCWRIREMRTAIKDRFCC